MIRRILILAAAALAGLTLAGPAGAVQKCSLSGTLSVCLSPPATVSGNVVIAPDSTTGSPGRVTYTLDGAHLLIAFDPPYAFTWPTARYADGSHTLGVSATAGVVTTPEVTFPITISNTGSPPGPGTFAPRSGTAPPAGRPFTLAAGGDGAGGETHATAITDEIASWSPNMMLYLGDVYDNGTVAEFYNWYGEATHRWFDRFKPITNPVIGNHEYDPVLGVTGYLDYWGNGADYYSVDVAGWHLIALNSNSQLTSGPELAWLQADLAKVPASRCTLAFYHHPVQNAGPEGEPIANSIATKLWTALAGKADIVLNGHDHSYQRFKPVSGMTEFVVGTTGHSAQAPVPDPRLDAFFGDIYGALRAELNPHGFGYRFVDESGQVRDSGAIPCAGRADASAPAAPTGLVQGIVSRAAIELRWQTPVDDVGVTGYDILRNGVVVGTTAGDTRFVDATVQAGVAYTYTVRARDVAGHVGPPSAGLVVLASSVAFLDTFESGDLAGWTTVVGQAAVTTAAARSGTWGLHLKPAGGPAYASHTLVTTFHTLEALVDFRLRSHSTQANLLTFADAAGARILTVFSQNSGGKLCYSFGPALTPVVCATSGRVDDNMWHRLRVTATTGASPRLVVLLDEAPVAGLGTSPALGTSPIARLVLGTTVNETYDADFDRVAADPLPIGDIVAPDPPSALSAHVVSGLRVDLSWSPAQDDIGVVAYDIYRNGALVGSVGATTGFADTSVDGLANYTYAVRAQDAAANVSALSPTAAANTPIVLRERFDTAAALKRFAPAVRLRWDARRRALRLRARAVGRIALPGSTSRLFARIKFRVVTRGANKVPLLAIRSAAGPIMTTAITARGRIGAALPASAQWHQLQVHADVGSRVVQVWLDGEQRTELAKTLPAGLPPITAIELGGAGTFDLLVDDLEANTRFMTDTVPPARPRVSARALRSRTVSLSWTAARDDVGVTGYRVFRGETEIGRTSGRVRHLVDRTAPAGARLTYGVRAVDAAGNLSPVAHRVVRVPWLSDPRRRVVRAGRPVQLTLPDAHHAVMLSLRVRPSSIPGRAVVARLGSTVLRFPAIARSGQWITIRARVARPGTVLRLGGAMSFDADRVLVR